MHINQRGPKFCPPFQGLTRIRFQADQLRCAPALRLKTNGWKWYKNHRENDRWHQLHFDWSAISSKENLLRPIMKILVSCVYIQNQSYKIEVFAQVWNSVKPSFYRTSTQSYIIY